jgi:hypothetical protein
VENIPAEFVVSIPVVLVPQFGDHLTEGGGDIDGLPEVVVILPFVGRDDDPRLGGGVSPSLI